MASTCRQKDQTNHAIKQMERALAICKGREGEHPKVTVEVARAHLHFGAALSRAGRHHEALASIKSAQEGLNHVVAWASACSSGDSGVDSIVQQARVLQCAAITAEVMELDPLMNIGNTDAAHAGPHGEAEDLCSKAKDLASTQLYPSHPLAVVVKRVCADHLLGSCSAAGNKPSPNPQKCVPHVEDDQGVIASTTLEHMDALDVQMVQHSGAKQIDVNADDSMRIGVNAEKTTKLQKSTDKESRAEKGAHSSGNGIPPQTTKLGSSAGRTQRVARNRGEKHDIFTEFIRSTNAEKEARRGVFADSAQDDVRRRLGATHRAAQLQMVHMTEEGLSDVRYSRAGHELFMKKLFKGNKSRSDPSLLAEARKSGESPEVVQLRKVCKLLPPPGSIENPHLLELASGHERTNSSA